MGPEQLLDGLQVVSSSADQETDVFLRGDAPDVDVGHAVRDVDLHVRVQADDVEESLHEIRRELALLLEILGFEVRWPRRGGAGSTDPHDGRVGAQPQESLPGLLQDLDLRLLLA